MTDSSPTDSLDTVAIEAESSDSDLTLQPRRWARIFVIITACYVVVALLPIVAPRWWLADLFANLRIQLLIAAALLTCGLFFSRCWKMLFLLTAISMPHLGWVIRPAATSRVDATLPKAITVMAANVFTGNQNYDEIERQFRDSDCDVVVISELSFGLSWHLNQSFAKDYPYFTELPADRGNFGMGMYSRLPLENASIEFLTGDLIPTVFADVQANGKRFHIVGVHTLPPIGKRMFEHRNRHLKLIADHVQDEMNADSDRAVIVMGDFNLTPWSPFFADFLGDANLNQATAGGRLKPTWYRWPLFPFGLVLDHVLLSDQLVCISRTIGQATGSDHRFVTVEVARRPLKSTE